MNTLELEKRLDVLVEGNVISKRASMITISAFGNLNQELGVDGLKQAEMLFTHLPAALTRIENGEELEGPDTNINDEIKGSTHYPIAQRQVTFIEEIWKEALPQEEKDFLYLHYINVIHFNSGGE